MIKDSPAQVFRPPVSNRADALLFKAVALVDVDEVERLAAELADEIEELIESPREQQIEELYAQLQALTQAVASPDRTKRWRKLTRQLRTLQKAEADEMEAYFEATSPLAPGTVDQAIRRADKILAAHGHPAISNGTRRKTT